MRCSSSVLSHEKNLHVNENMDWILSAAFKNSKKSMQRKWSMSLKSPKCCFPLYSFQNKKGSQNGEVTKEESVKQSQTESKDRSKIKRIQGQYFVSMQKVKSQKKGMFY